MGFLSDLDKVSILSNGNNFLNQRQYGLAKIQFKRYLDTYGYEEGVVERKALCHMQLGEYGEAISCYNTILSHGRNKFALNNKGHAFNENGQPNTALKALNECTKYYPDYAEAWSNKGRSLAALGRYSESFECYEKALEIKPYLYEAQVGLQFLVDKKNEFNNNAIELDGKRKYNEALKYYDKAIEITPNDSILYSNKGVTLRNKNDNEGAIKAFEEALKYDNFNGMALDNLSILYNEKGIRADNARNYEKAIEYYDKAIEMDPTDSIIYSNKGVALKNKNNIEDAIKTFEEALEYNKSNEVAMNNLSIIYNEIAVEADNAGNYEKALKYYDKSLEMDNKDPIVLCNKGILLYENNNKKDSTIWFRKALDIDKENGTALKYLSIISKEEKEREKKLRKEEEEKKKAKQTPKKIDGNKEVKKIFKKGKNDIDEIERWFNLYEKGAITKEEYEIKKNEILNFTEDSEVSKENDSNVIEYDAEGRKILTEKELSEVKYYFKKRFEWWTGKYERSIIEEYKEAEACLLMILPFNKKYESVAEELEVIQNLSSSLMWLYEDMEEEDLDYIDLKYFLNTEEWTLYDYFKLEDMFGFKKIIENKKSEFKIEKCPYCGHYINAKTKRCQYCNNIFNENLEDEMKRQEREEQRKRHERIQNANYNRMNKKLERKECPNCNHSLNKVAKKCPYCGHEFIQVKEGLLEKEKKENEIKRKTKLKLIVENTNLDTVSKTNLKHKINKKEILDEKELKKQIQNLEREKWLEGLTIEKIDAQLPLAKKYNKRNYYKLLEAKEELLKRQR